MNFLDQFSDWMIKKGTIKKVQGVEMPHTSMSHRTAKQYKNSVARILEFLGYVKTSGKTHRRKLSIVSGKDWRQIGIPELKSYFEKKYPPGQRLPQKRKNFRFQEATAVKKFGSFMYYEKKFWSEDKHLELKRAMTYSGMKLKDLVIEPPNKAHPFAEWLWKEDVGMGFVLFLMQWIAGMRYSEVAETKLDLNDGSLSIDWGIKKATITGKGAEGKDREMAFHDFEESKIREYLEWRKELPLESDALCVVRDERTDDEYLPLPYHVDNINVKLKEWARKYNAVVGDGISLNIDLVSTHKLGRHIFGTFFGRKVPEKTLMEWMGITSHPVIQRYINFNWEEKAEMRRKVVQSYINGGGKARPAGDVTSVLQDVRDLAPAGWEDAWNGFVDGLEGLLNVATATRPGSSTDAKAG